MNYKELDYISGDIPSIIHFPKTNSSLLWYLDPKTPPKNFIILSENSVVLPFSDRDKERLQGLKKGVTTLSLNNFKPIALSDGVISAYKKFGRLYAYGLDSNDEVRAVLALEDFGDGIILLDVDLFMYGFSDTQQIAQASQALARYSKAVAKNKPIDDIGFVLEDKTVRLKYDGKVFNWNVSWL